MCQENQMNNISISTNNTSISSTSVIGIKPKNIQQNIVKKDFKKEIPAKHLQNFESFQKSVQQEAQTLFKGREEYISKYTNENQLVRQFIARDFKQKDAFKLWNKWVNWMQENDADNIKEKDIQNELKAGKCFMNGYDKKGNPIVIVQAKYHVPKAIAIEESKRFFIYMIQKIIEESDRVGVERITLIWDRSGFGKSNYDSELMDMFKDLIGMMQDCYSERLDTCVILFPNFFFKMIWGIVKVFLNKRTTDKIKVYSDVKQLREIIEEDQLIKEYEGSSEFQYKFPECVFGQEDMQKQFLQNLVEQKIIEAPKQIQKLQKQTSETSINEELLECDFQDINESCEESQNNPNQYSLREIKTKASLQRI